MQTLAVLNPLRQTDPRITNDTDLAGPLIFCLLFGVVLLMVSNGSFVQLVAADTCLSSTTVWEGALWLHLWGWSVGLLQYVCCVEPHELRLGVSDHRCQCPRLLSPAYGDPLLFLNHCTSTVSNTDTPMHSVFPRETTEVYTVVKWPRVL